MTEAIGTKVPPMHQELYTAYQNGAQIEYWEPLESRWRPAPNPMWIASNHYRLRQWKAGTFYRYLRSAGGSIFCHTDSVSPDGQFLWLADGEHVAEADLISEALEQVFPIEWSRKNVG